MQLSLYGQFTAKAPIPIPSPLPADFRVSTQPAPDFTALTTNGYENRWPIIAASGYLFLAAGRFHPGLHDRVHHRLRPAFRSSFAALDTALLGLSIDSHYAHIAWVRSIKQSFGVDIDFPIIADLDMKVARPTA